MNWVRGGLIGILLQLMALPGAVGAQAPLSENIPILLTADEMNYDRDHGIVTARGNVEISQNDRILTADSVTYNQREDLLSASGHVSLLEPSGDVLFAEYMELSGDFKDGILRDLRAVLRDTSRIAAAGARRSNGEVLTMSKAVYSPCDLCKDEPAKPPLWQVKAVRVIHDQPRQTVEYRDAWLEVAGVPVAYTPYLSHPDPTVKRRTGFLAPVFGSTSNLGFFVDTPYFVDVSPSADVTVAPRFTSDEGPVMAGDFRQRFRQGTLDGNASITNDSKNDTRGHIRSKGRFDVNETWRWGLDLDRTSDDTYLRRYRYGNENDTLTSRLFTEGFRGANYASASTYAFQGLRQEDRAEQIPYVLPMLSYSHFGEPDGWGGRTKFDAGAVALTRTDGTDTRRLSAVSGWHRPFETASGNLFDVSTSLWGQAYHVNRLDRPGDTEFTGVSGRLVPEAALGWRFPVVRDEGNVYQSVEPLANVVVSPRGGNSNRIPNEDSVDFEFDDTNLFSVNRFPGVDRVEGGPRVNYGVRWGAFGDRGGSTTALIGQSYRPYADDTFAKGSGLEEQLSDIVGRITVQPVANWLLLYRGRWDKDNLENRRSELSTSLGPKTLNLSVNYLLFDRREGSEFPGREEIRVGVTAQLTRYWSSNAAIVRDLDQDGGTRSAQLGFIYEDECFILATRLARSYFQDRDLKPDDSIILQIVFKTLGELQSSVY